MKTLTIISIAILTSALFINANKIKKCKSADLKIIKIEQPEYASEIKGTIVKVWVKNLGKQKSKPTRIMLMDLDILPSEAAAQGASEIAIELLEENHSIARHNSSWGYEKFDIDADTADYDLYFEKWLPLEALPPGKSATLEFQIPDFWVYNPNCEIRAIADPEQEIRDCDRSNNQLDFFGWG